jgi:hypothetical protein
VAVRWSALGPCQPGHNPVADQLQAVPEGVHRPGRLNERHPASWKLWLQDLALDSLETSAGIVGGWSSLALLPHVRPPRRSMRNLVGTASLVGPE